MKKTVWSTACLAIAMAIGPAVTHAATTKPAALKIAIVTFFSSSGAVVGGPTADAAKLTIDEINRAGGIDGVPIQVQYIDKSAGRPRTSPSCARWLAMSLR